MNKQVEVSVIIPCYNSSGTIQRAVNSVLRQEGVETEIILVDDGSTDDSVEKAKGVTGNRLKIQQLKGPSGTGKARNEGLKIAEGNWIQFLDADDSLEPGKLRKQLAVSDYADIIISGWNLFIQDRLAEKQFPKKLASAENRLEVLLRENQIHSAAPLVRKTLVNDVGGFKEELYHEDWEFWVSLFSREPRTVFYPEYLSNYYRNVGGKSWDTRKRLTEDIQLLEFLLRSPEYKSHFPAIKKELRKKRIDTFTAFWVSGQNDKALEQVNQLENMNPVENAIVLLVKTGMVSRAIAGGVGPRKVMRRLSGFIKRFNK